MKISALCSALLVGLAVACGDGGSDGGGDEVAVPEVEVPSMEEAEAAAEESIDESNMDDEMAKLGAEIDADG